MICESCGAESHGISASIGICRDCIESKFDKHKDRLAGIHTSVRRDFGLQESAPKKNGGSCGKCVRECAPDISMTGYCGARRLGVSGMISASGPRNAAFATCSSAALDSISCTSARFTCNRGKPAFFLGKGGSQKPSGNRISVSYASCNFNCLFCREWSFRERAVIENLVTPQEIAEMIDDRTFCLSFTGGDPATQSDHALETARLALDKKSDLKICWETNGSENFEVLREMISISGKTGGGIKFDIKAFSPKIHFALCGVSNGRTIANFRALAEASKKPGAPAVVASTTLVPGYVTPGEVWRIAELISSRSPRIPYLLFPFSPHFYLNDLPRTSEKHATAALEASIDAGVENVRIHNKEDLGDFEYMP
ncbi:MAG TPA: radical SAM protein [bacterium]|nr:radical SAM protein [bacterium]